MKGFRFHVHRLPAMTADDYWAKVREAARWERDAEPWTLPRMPNETGLWVANWRCPFMRRQTERLSVDRLELRRRYEAHMASASTRAALTQCPV